MGASQLQCFAAGAALCATSLGTTFTVLGTSGLIKSRLGVVLTSAAMMDDVVGLVMVQVISNLGKSNSAFSAITVVRPVCVSFAFATAAPLVCMFVVKPLTIGLNGWRAKYPRGLANRTFKTRETALAAHAAVFLGCVTGASYAGTSTLFAAYIAGAAISWWDAEVPHYRQPVVAAESQDSSQGSEQRGDVRDNGATSFTGTEIFEHYFLAPLNRILRPFFFVSHIFYLDNPCVFSHYYAGVYWVLDTHYRDVHGRNCVEGSSIYRSHDFRQDLLRRLASPHIV